MRKQLSLWLYTAVLTIAFSQTSAQDGPRVHTGTLLETMDSGGYTYMHIEENGTSFWAAAPQTTVNQGATVRVAEQMWMTNFTSKTLERTFDKLLFASMIGGTTATPTASNTDAKPRARRFIDKAMGGYTVAEIYSQKDTLKGKTVKVRGEVVKVSKNIMQRTWVHIQDGTDDTGNNDIVFRTEGNAPDVGTVVMAEGILDTDRDFGYGYVYAVIVEDASFGQ